MLWKLVYIENWKCVLVSKARLYKCQHVEKNFGANQLSCLGLLLLLLQEDFVRLTIIYLDGEEAKETL